MVINFDGTEDSRGVGARAHPTDVSLLMAGKDRHAESKELWVTLRNSSGVKARG